MRDGWVSPWWQAECLPDRWDVCGVVVPSLSVWHVFHLDQIGNPYLCGGAPDYDAAAGLLLVASHGRNDGRRIMLDEAFRAKAMRAVYRPLRRVKADDVVRQCSDYVETCTSVVDRFEKAGGGGRPAVVPVAFHLVRRLCRDYGLTIDQAWAFPYARARCYYDASAEADGDDSLVSVDAQRMADANVEAGVA
jgi:hypothetical protein